MLGGAQVGNRKKRVATTIASFQQTLSHLFYILLLYSVPQGSFRIVTENF
jgi:hypothetical protein